MCTLTFQYGPPSHRRLFSLRWTALRFRVRAARYFFFLVWWSGRVNFTSSV
jgi:hypothetical protein